MGAMVVVTVAVVMAVVTAVVTAVAVMVATREAPKVEGVPLLDLWMVQPLAMLMVILSPHPA